MLLSVMMPHFGRRVNVQSRKHARFRSSGVAGDQPVQGSLSQRTLQCMSQNDEYPRCREHTSQHEEGRQVYSTVSRIVNYPYMHCSFSFLPVQHCRQI